MNEEVTLKQGIQMMDEESANKFLTFFTNGQLYGVPISDVVSIMSMQAITPIPEFPPYAKGIINVRGSIIPVIDMRIRLNLAEKEYDDRTCTIVTLLNGNSVGLIVDEVDEVANIPQEHLLPAPSLTSEDAQRYVTGIGDIDEKLILLMDTSKILGSDEIHVIVGSNANEGDLAHV